MGYWLTINKENLQQDLREKANHISVGERHNCKPVLYPVRDGRGRIEGFGFWFYSNALRLLSRALSLGFQVERYDGNSNEYYLRGEDFDQLGLVRNEIGQWFPVKIERE